MVGCVGLVGKRGTAHVTCVLADAATAPAVQMKEAPSRLRWERSSVVLLQDSP